MNNHTIIVACSWICFIYGTIVGIMGMSSLKMWKYLDGDFILLILYVSPSFSFLMLQLCHIMSYIFKHNKINCMSKVFIANSIIQILAIIINLILTTKRYNIANMNYYHVTQHDTESLRTVTMSTTFILFISTYSQLSMYGMLNV